MAVAGWANVIQATNHSVRPNPRATHSGAVCSCARDNALVVPHAKPRENTPSPSPSLCFLGKACIRHQRSKHNNNVASRCATGVLRDSVFAAVLRGAIAPLTRGRLRRIAPRHGCADHALRLAVAPAAAASALAAAEHPHPRSCRRDVDLLGGVHLARSHRRAAWHAVPARVPLAQPAARQRAALVALAHRCRLTSIHIHTAVGAAVAKKFSSEKKKTSSLATAAEQIHT